MAYFNEQVSNKIVLSSELSWKIKEFKDLTHATITSQELEPVDGSGKKEKEKKSQENQDLRRTSRISKPTDEQKKEMKEREEAEKAAISLEKKRQVEENELKAACLFKHSFGVCNLAQQRLLYRGDVRDFSKIFDQPFKSDSICEKLAIVGAEVDVKYFRSQSDFKGYLFRMRAAEIEVDETVKDPETNEETIIKVKKLKAAQLDIKEYQKRRCQHDREKGENEPLANTICLDNGIRNAGTYIAAIGALSIQFYDEYSTLSESEKAMYGKFMKAWQRQADDSIFPAITNGIWMPTERELAASPLPHEMDDQIALRPHISTDVSWNLILFRQPEYSNMTCKVQVSDAIMKSKQYYFAIMVQAKSFVCLNSHYIMIPALQVQHSAIFNDTNFVPAINRDGSITFTAKLRILHVSSSSLENHTHSPSSFINSLNSQMYNSKSYADFKFIINGKEFMAHKCLLANASKVFDKLFTLDMVEKISNCCHIEHISAEVFELLLQFIYTGYAEIDDKAIELYDSANYYEIEQLKTFCLIKINEYLADNPTLDLLKELFEFSVKYEIREVAIKCWIQLKRIMIYETVSLSDVEKILTLKVKADELLQI